MRMLRLFTIAGLQLLLLQQLHFKLCEGRNVGWCASEGIRCHENEKPWQHDGVCVKPSKNAVGKCTLPDTRKFRLAIVARLRQLKRLPDSRPVSTLWIRGSGPGLSWEKPIQLKKTATQLDAWQVELSYKSDSNGLPCLSSSHCAVNQNALEFRFYRDEFAHESMLGPNFYIPLPISHSMYGAADFFMPKVEVYPWFDGTMIRSVEFSLNSSRQVTGKEGGLRLTMSMIYPPSFDYNIHKTYPLVITFGREDAIQIIPLLEHMYVYEASIEEAIVVAIHHKDKAPFCYLSPYSMMNVSRIWRCKPGLRECHDCQTCWDARRSEPCDREEYINKAEGCLASYTCNGVGDQLLDFIELDLLPELLERTAHRLQIDFPSQRISILGHDGAGLLACYAAVTRPSIYGNAACLSAPFAWPLRNAQDPEAAFINATLSFAAYKLKQQPELQVQFMNQKYYIDIGEDDNFFNPLYDPYRDVEMVIRELKEYLKLKMNENILYYTVPGVGNSYYHFPSGGKILHRIKHALQFFFKAKGGSNREFVRMIQLSETFYAKQRAKFAGVEGMSYDANDVGAAVSNDSQYCDIHHEADSKGGDVPLPIFLSILGRSV